MKKNCAFTICATNYIGLAKVLEKSIKSRFQEVDFYIIVADEPGESCVKSLEDNVLIAKEALKNTYPEEKWIDMAFKYDLTEFCTAIKPASIKYLFEKGYEKCIYFDPDIFVFSSISCIYESLDKYEAIVTPHITQIHLAEKGNIREQQLLCSGVYNLGFIGLRNTDCARKFICWWLDKLKDKSFASIPENLFTDQKWVDLLPSFMGGKLCVSMDMGLNMAPWNFHERMICEKNADLYVGCREGGDSQLSKLVFVHFSGYNYKALLNGEVIQRNIRDMSSYEDLNVLFKMYKKNLELSHIDDYISHRYTYGTFDNGCLISKEVRRLYRAYSEAYGYYDNPFSKQSRFYSKVKKMRMVPEPNENNVSKIHDKDVVNKKKYKAICIANSVMRCLCFLLGFKKYALLYKMASFYGTIENHYFLVSSKNSRYKIRESF